MAQLVTMTDDGLVATPLPMLYEPAADGLGSLVGHVARANRQWADTHARGRGVGDLHRLQRLHLAELVPVEARARQGRADVELRDGARPRHFVVHDDTEWKRALVTRLTNSTSRSSPRRGKSTDAPPDYIESMLKAIVGIELQITSIQAKRKLSQNRPEDDVAGTIAGLTAAGGSSAALAEVMQKPS